MSLSSSLSSFNYNRNENIYDKTSYSHIISRTIYDIRYIEFLIKQKFIKKYTLMTLNYNSTIIDNIIYNDKTHIVALFKDYLILDDKGDFLKRYYTKYESLIRLPKFFEFYNLYSKLFPNYTCIEEGKYFYRNIQKKQEMINIQEKIENEIKNKKNNFFEENSDKSDKVFSTNVIDSLLNDTNKEGIELLFNININNLKKDEKSFYNKINTLIDEINKFKKNHMFKVLKKNNNIIQSYQNQQFTKILKNKNNDNILHLIRNNNKKHFCKIKHINSNLNNNDNNKKKELKQNSISRFINNINKSKNKSKNENNNVDIINSYNDNYVKINLHHKHKMSNSNLSKLNVMTDRTLLDKLDQNYIKIRQKFMINNKNVSQNMSTSAKTKKDISFSKKNKSMNTKKPNSISTSYNSLLNNLNGLTYLIISKSSTSEIKNIKKEIISNNCINSYASSKNKGLNFSSFYINNSSKNNINNNSNIYINKNIKHNITMNNNYNTSRNISIKNIDIKKIKPIKKIFNDSRNKKVNKNKLTYIKRNSNSKCSVLSNTNSLFSYLEPKDNSNPKKNKNIIHKNTNSLFNFNNLTNININMRDLGYKKFDLKNNIIKKKILKNGLKIINTSNTSRNNQTILPSSKNLTNSKVNYSKIKNSSTAKLRIIEPLKDIKKNNIKNIKINNFAKLFNFLNHCNKNIRSYKSKTERIKKINNC